MLNYFHIFEFLVIISCLTSKVTTDFFLLGMYSLLVIVLSVNQSSLHLILGG